MFTNDVFSDQCRALALQQVACGHARAIAVELNGSAYSRKSGSAAGVSEHAGRLADTARAPQSRSTDCEIERLKVDCAALAPHAPG